MAKKLTKKQYDLFCDIIERRNSLKTILKNYNVSLEQFNQWMKEEKFHELIILTYKYNLIQLRYQQLKDLKIARAKLMKLMKSASGDLLLKICSKIMEFPELPDDIEIPISKEEYEGISTGSPWGSTQISDTQASEILQVLADSAD